ncbi:putative secreted protein [Vibrio vulnificus]|nr:putative secreted protein [Vibrio vulnificus]OQK66796.1 putative secreted protein [Vibrio vulnificus]
MKLLKLVCLGILSVMCSILYALLSSNNDDTKQIDDFNNPDSDPFHNGDWEDHEGNTYSQHMDGSQRDSFGKRWDD